MGHKQRCSIFSLEFDGQEWSMKAAQELAGMLWWTMTRTTAEAGLHVYSCTSLNLVYRSALQLQRTTRTQFLYNLIQYPNVHPHHSPIAPLTVLYVPGIADTLALRSWVWHIINIFLYWKGHAARLPSPSSQVKYYMYLPTSQEVSSKAVAQQI